MADVSVTLTIPSEKVANAVACLKWYGTAQLHLTQGKQEADGEFAKRVLKSIVVSLDARYRGMLAAQQAQQGVSVDNDLVT